METLDIFREQANENRIHTQKMYVSAFRHAVSLVEIDPIKGLETLKDRLKLEEKELERIKKEVKND